MTIINSMDMPTYVGILLIMFVLSIYSIVKYRKIKEPWKVICPRLCRQYKKDYLK